MLNAVPQKSNGPLYVKGVTSIEAIANTGTVGTRGARGPQTVGDCEWVPLRRNPGRMNATIKLMVVQVNNDDLPDHSDKIRAPPMRLKCSSRVDRTSHFLDLIWTLRPRTEEAARERSRAAIQ